MTDERQFLSLEDCEPPRLWTPYFHAEVAHAYGEDWPTVLVEKWEEDAIGQKRFVASKSYVIADAD